MDLLRDFYMRPRQTQTQRQKHGLRDRSRETRRETDRQTDRQRETETENSNWKTLFYKDCSLDSVKNLATSPC